jgi:hypothetical protein
MAFVIITNPKEPAPRVKISLIKTGMGNAISADLPENAMEPVVEKDRERATVSTRGKVKEAAADRALSTEMVVAGRDMALQPNQRNK